MSRATVRFSWSRVTCVHARERLVRRVRTSVDSVVRAVPMNPTRTTASWEHVWPLVFEDSRGRNARRDEESRSPTPIAPRTRRIRRLFLEHRDAQRRGRDEGVRAASKSPG